MKLKVEVSQDIYRALCEQDSSIPLFSQAWWLDAVAGAEHWDVVLVLRGEEVVGALPYVIKRRWGMTLLSQPPLTQTLGPWVRSNQAKYATALATEKDILGTLADGLPLFAGYRQNWDSQRMNWLPFYWRNFNQTTRYTYRLVLGRDEEFIWQELQGNIRREIRKARDRFSLTIRPARSIDEFLDVNLKTFERQGKAMPYSRELVRSLHAASEARNACDMLVAEDAKGNLHAAAYVVRGATTAYYLMGGGDPEYRNSGAGSLCLWEAIKRQPDHIKCFDFEGSMLEPVERFFRAFGAVQTPYFCVQRLDSKILRLVECSRSLVCRKY